VVAIPKAVVDERAVVVKLFDATATGVAMEGSLSLHDLVIAAEVVKADLVLQGLVDYFDIVVLLQDVAGVQIN
jgi:hypothetical protein